VLCSNNIPHSTSAGSICVLLDCDEVFVAGFDAPLLLDVSSEASLQLDNTPSAGPQNLVNLWQSGLIAWKLTALRNYRMRHSAAVGFVDNVHW
jgi:hypothetical protein